MRIAQVAPIIESVPPKKYGGTERVISALTEELVKRGHEVTLFASGDSVTSAELTSVYPTSLRESGIKDLYKHNVWSLSNVGLAYQYADQYDIIHDHNSENCPVSLPLANISHTPVVMTLHGALTQKTIEKFEFYNRPHLVKISDKQSAPAEHLNYIARIYHGLEMNDYPFNVKPGKYLLFVGRIRYKNGTDEKGLLNAIHIAKKAGLPLKIASKLDDTIPEDVNYFQNMIKPHLSDMIEWIGEVDEKERNRLMANALCLLHPINFEEPFGLTLIEAMACACPVVAFPKGSIPEIVQDGKTGFIASSIDDAVLMIKKLHTIDRLMCRMYALEEYSVERMADEYEDVYYQLLQKPLRTSSFTSQSRLSLFQKKVD